MKARNGERVDFGKEEESSSRDEAMEILLDEGIGLIHAKKHPEAITCFDRIIREFESRYPDSDEERRIACQSIEEFLAYFQSRESDATPVVWIDPCYAQAHYYKAYALIQSDSLDEAARNLERAVELNPVHSTYYLELAYLHARWRMFDSALQLYNRAVQVDYCPEHSNTAAAYRGIGYVYIESRLLTEASRMYERSLEIEPDNAIAKNELEYIGRLRQMGYRSARTQ